MKKRTMSAEDVATYLGLHKDTIYNLVREQKIPHIETGERIFFLEEVLDRWMLEGMYCIIANKELQCLHPFVNLSKLPFTHYLLFGL